jgi:hypothetical protein
MPGPPARRRYSQPCSWSNAYARMHTFLLWRFCAQFVPEDVASGDLSDFVDCGISNLHVLNTSKGSPLQAPYLMRCLAVNSDVDDTAHTSAVTA